MPLSQMIFAMLILMGVWGVISKLEKLIDALSAAKTDRVHAADRQWIIISKLDKIIALLGGQEDDEEE